MLKFLYANRLLIGVLMGVILIVVGGTYYLKHLDYERTLEKERNLQLDYPQWHLPEWAKARIGTGTIHTMQYSPDGNQLAVVSSIGVWIFDAKTAETQHLLAAHSGVINSISFSSDGRTLAVGTENGEAQLWDTSTGKHQKTFTRRDYFFGVNTVFIMPDGHTLAVIYASMVDLWDITTGQRKNTLSTTENETSDETVNNIPNMYMSLGGYRNSFSSDGKTVASDSEKDSFRFWDIATRKEIRTLKAERTSRSGELVSFSSDLQTVAIASHSYKGPRHSRIWEINLWDVNTQTPKKILETSNIFDIPFLVFSPDGNLVASYIYDDKAIRIWDVNTGKEKNRLKGHKIIVSTAAFSPDNRTLVSVSYDNMLRFWDVSTGKEKKTVTGYGGSSPNVLFSANGQTLMSLEPGNAIRQWNTSIGQHEKNFVGHKLNWDTALSPDGRSLASRSVLKNTIHLWDINTGEHSKIKGPRRNVSGIAFSQDSQTLAIWGSSGKNNDIVQFYDADTGDIKRTLQLKVQDDIGLLVYVYFDKKMFAGIGKYIHTNLFVWNLITDDYKITDIGAKEVIVAQFSPNGRVLAVVGKTLPQQKTRMERKIVLRDVETGDHIRTLIGHKDEIVSLAFSPDGQTLASGSSLLDKTIRLWDVATGSSKDFTDPNWAERQHKFEAKVASSLAFSPDGQTLASGMKLGDILLWETATGVKKKTLRGHSETVSQIFFSADGQTLISASHDGTILIWDLSHL